MTTTKTATTTKRTTKAAANPATAKPGKGETMTKTKNATKRAAPAPTANLETGVAMLALGDLHTAGINPRSTFDAAAMAELEASIAANGILQSITVRRCVAGFEVIAGERRFRAVTALALAGDWDQARLIPCRILEPELEAGDGDQAALSAAIVENVQREDLSALDEGRAFARLRDADPKRWSPAAIAKAIGKSRRHVLLRFALVDKLGAKATTALDAGEIPLAAARALAIAPPSVQDKVIAGTIAGGASNPYLLTYESVRREILRKLPAMEHRIFDRAHYKGEIVGDDRDRRAADVEQYDRLQAAALEALKIKLGKKCAFVDVLDYNSGDDRAFYAGDYGIGKGHQAGAVIVIQHGGHIVVLEDRLRPSDELEAAIVRSAVTIPMSAAAAAEAKAAKLLPTQLNMADVARRKTAALQAAVIEDPLGGLRVAVFALLGGGQVEINAGEIGRDDMALAPVIAEKAAAWAKRIKSLELALNARPVLRIKGSAGQQWRRDVDAAAVPAWRAIGKLKADDLVELLGVLVATQVGTWNGFRATLGDNGIAAALASDFKADAWQTFNADALVEFMETARPYQLRRIAAAGGIDKVDGKAIATASGKALRAEIKDRAANMKLDAAAYKIPELGFGTREEIEAASCDQAAAGD